MPTVEEGCSPVVVADRALHMLNILCRCIENRSESNRSFFLFFVQIFEKYRSVNPLNRYNFFFLILLDKDISIYHNMDNYLVPYYGLVIDSSLDPYDLETYLYSLGYRHILVIKYGFGLAICDSRTRGTDIEVNSLWKSNDNDISMMNRDMEFSREYYKGRLNISIRTDTYDILRRIGYTMGLSEKEILAQMGCIYEYVHDDSSSDFLLD